MGQWRRTVATVGLLLVLSGNAGAADSGTYRGPENNGIYPETGILRKWPDGGPQLLWKRRLSGTGFSSVTVEGGKVYATAGGMCALHVFALDGEEVARIPAGPSTFKRFGGGSRSTTVVRGNVAVTTSPLSDVYAMDLVRQERRWAFNVSKEWGEELGQAGWGYCESPMLFRNKIILGATSTRPEDPFLMAFDIETGEMAWGANWGEPLDRAHHYQSPSSSGACFNHRGRWLISFTAHSYHTLVDAETGRLIWQIKSRGHHDITPVYNDGYLLWGPNSGWHRDPSVPKIDGLQMMRLSDDGSSYEVLWTRRENLTAFSEAVILNGRVYVYGRRGTPAEKPDPAWAHGPIKRTVGKTPAGGGAADGEADEPPEPLPVDKKQPGEFLCLDAKTGALIAGLPVSTNFAAPGHVVSADGLVFFLELLKTARGLVPRLTMFEPTAGGFEKTGTLDIPVDEGDLRVSEVEWQARTPPVIAEKRLFVRYGSIFAFDVRGEPPARGWRQDGSGVAIEAAPPIRWHEKLNVLWQAELPMAPASSPVAGPDRLFVMGRAGDLACLDAAGGALLWRCALREEGGGAEAGPQPTPVARGERVFAVSRDGAVAAFTGGGTRLWGAKVEVARERPVASPLLAGNVLVIQGREMAGLNADGGQVLWRTPVPDGPVWGTPVRLTLGRLDLVVTGWGTLVRVGDGVAVAAGLPSVARDSPVVSGNDIFVWRRADGRGEGSAASAFRVSDAGGGRVSLAKRWERALPGGAPACSPLALDGMLYGLTEDGFLLGLDAGSGATCYSQRLGGAAPGADAAPRSLIGCGARLYAVNGDGDGGTHVVAAGPRFEDLWSYVVGRGIGEPAFLKDRLFLAAGRRVVCVGGATPVEPRAPKVLAVAPMPLQALPPGLPVEPFGNDRIPDAWLFCGPIPGRDLDTDHLVPLGGRAAARPNAGAELALGATTLTFRTLEPRHRWRDPKFTADRLAIDVTGCFDRKPDSTGCLFTVISNETPRYVRFGLHTPNGATWNFKERLEARVWLGGERIEETDIVRLVKGFCPLLMQITMGKCEAHGKIWVGPHFEDVTERYGTLVAEQQRLSAVWPEYVAAAGLPFVVAGSGIRRAMPEDAGDAGPGNLEDRSPAERKRLLDDLGLRFAAIPERAYEMLATEVTQRQWALLMGTQPWAGQDLTAVGPDCPATHVSWHETVRFAGRLTLLDPAHCYRLPLQAEWRHAAQAGLNGRWCFGSSASNLTEYAWYIGNAEPDRFARPVAQLKPSAWGLYDINGNVSEWCGDDLGRARIAKGGAWYSLDWFCDVQKSPRYGPRYRSYGLGFRLLREAKGTMADVPRHTAAGSGE